MKFVALSVFAALAGLVMLTGAFSQSSGGTGGDSPGSPRLEGNQPDSSGGTAGTLDESRFVVSYLPTDVELNPIKSISSVDAQLYTAIYEGLVTYNPVNLRPVPGVARYWEVSPDGKKYLFYLRKDAKYWTGDPVRAQDFRDSWLELLKPSNHSAYSFLLDVIVGAKAYRTGENTDPSSVGIKALSDTLLEVDLVQPAAHFLEILCNHSFVPIHPSLLHFSDWSKLPSVISNGPYYIVKRTPTEIDLAKNELYWDADRVKIPRITIEFRDDAKAVTSDFNSDKVQWVTGGIQLDAIKDRNSLVVNSLFATTYYFFSTDRAPWNDSRVRRAMILLLPLADIRNDKYQYIPATTLVPQISLYPDVTSITKQNVDEAKSLLTQAGFPDGKGLPDVVISVPQGAETDRVVGIMKDTWEKQLGVKVTVSTTPYQQYTDSLAGSDFTLGTLTWIGDFADPLTFLQMWTTGSNLNDAQYSNKQYDDLVNTAVGKSGVDRYKLLAQAEQILLTDGVVLPISHAPAINLIDLTRINGWFPNPLDIHPFKYLSYAGAEPPKGIVRSEDDGASAVALSSSR